jgi:hypothetical protein
MAKMPTSTSGESGADKGLVVPLDLVEGKGICCIASNLTMAGTFLGSTGGSLVKRAKAEWPGTETAIAALRQIVPGCRCLQLHRLDRRGTNFDSPAHIRRSHERTSQGPTPQPLQGCGKKGTTHEWAHTVRARCYLQTDAPTPQYRLHPAKPNPTASRGARIVSTRPHPYQLPPGRLSRIPRRSGIDTLIIAPQLPAHCHRSVTPNPNQPTQTHYKLTYILQTHSVHKPIVTHVGVLERAGVSTRWPARHPRQHGRSSKCLGWAICMILQRRWLLRPNSDAALPAKVPPDRGDSLPNCRVHQHADFDSMERRGVRFA